MLNVACVRCGAVVKKHQGLDDMRSMRVRLARIGPGASLFPQVGSSVSGCVQNVEIRTGNVGHTATLLPERGLTNPTPGFADP